MRKTFALIVTLLAGGASAAAILALPVGQLEMWLASAGISELIPAAAPPLGMKAHMLLAGGVAVVAMALAALILPVKSNTHKDNEKMGLGSKIARFARGRAAAEADGKAQPVLRRADAHPDAPARAPIFASRDLGAEAFEKVMPQSILTESADPVAQPAALPRSPEPLPAAMLQQEVARMEESAPRRLRPLPLPTRPAHTEDLRGLSLSELTQRLEEGLSRRGLVIGAAAAPVAPVPTAPISILRQVPPVTDADSDAALQTALAALRNITAKAG